ncbi:hypothetical protein [Methylobacter sp.]|uniref:hypothetical protein n=1 Tax=Methylobacter sp. TaxID=2051955 RepID=UPI0012033D80|nr:hypothetical protein [Methylobacter sp.]TAK63183.1 MAG: hypothetical protein EPO18_07680 [Methylobacter sp.]
MTERRSVVRVARGERGIWQRRFLRGASFDRLPSTGSGQAWEHLIRDDENYAAHIGYCHINPLKHGLVEHMADWPYSTFHRYVDRGVYPSNWATRSSCRGEAKESNSPSGAKTRFK